MVNTCKLKNEIDEIRCLLNSLTEDISSNDDNYNYLLDISKRMDKLILEYMKMENENVLRYFKNTGDK